MQWEKKNLLIDKIEESAPETPINTPKISSVEVSSISNNLSERLDKRYKIWKEIVNINLPIAKKLME